MEGLIAISVFIAVTAAVTALLARPTSTVQRRLQTFREMAVVDEPLEREPSFMDRVMRPLIRWTLGAIRVALPTTIAEKLQWRLTVAGDPLSLMGLIIVWGGMIAGLPVLLLFLATTSGSVSEKTPLMAVMSAALGAYLPHFWLNMRASRRRTEFLKGLPDAIDLLSTSVEAGLGVDAAIGQVAEKVKGVISVEFRRLLREMAMGSSRRDALKALAARADLPDVQQFVNALVQAEATGVSLGQVIRVQADQMRLRRRQRAEQQAHKAPVKITVPLVLFIFPTILVVILGPAAIQISQNFTSK